MGLITQATDDALSNPALARSTVTTSGGERLALPAALLGRWVRFTADGLALHVRFGDATVTVDPAARSSSDLTPNGDEPHLSLAAGASLRVRVRADWTHLAHVAAGTTGALRMTLSEGAHGAE